TGGIGRPSHFAGRPRFPSSLPAAAARYLLTQPPCRRLRTEKQSPRFGGGERGGPVLKHPRSREDWSGKSLPEKGFTLVELLVVIVILGILAAVVVFAVSGSTDNAQKKSCSAELSAVETGLEAYKASEGSYPTNISQLTSGANQY